MLWKQRRKVDPCERVTVRSSRPELPLRHSEVREHYQSLLPIMRFTLIKSEPGRNGFSRKCQGYFPTSGSERNGQMKTIRLVFTRKLVVSRLRTIGSKKNLDLSINEKRAAIDRDHPEISMSRQCELLGLPPSTYYYKPREPREEDLAIMQAIDRIFTKHPFFGSRRIADSLQDEGLSASRDKVRRLMSLMGIEAIYPKKRNLSKRNHEHKVYPYLLRGLSIDHPDQVWCSDVTFIRLKHGWAYLTVVMDWYSRYIISWELSMTMDTAFVLRCLNKALDTGTPEIFNTDQGSQYTSNAFTDRLTKAGVRISMDGKGRAFDNIMVERLWRTVKYEEVYLNEYGDFFKAWENMEKYISFYNDERRHSSLDKQTPSERYHGYRREQRELA